MFGIDDIFLALSALQAGNSVFNPPAGPQNTIGAAPSAAPPSFMQSQYQLPQPDKKEKTQPKAIQIDSNVFEQAAQAAAAATKGPPPTVPLQAPSGPPVGPPAPGGGPVGPPAPPQQQPPPPPTGGSIGEILAAAPGAIANVAGLLGLGQSEPRRQMAAPIPGGSQGNVVPGFNLPQNIDIGTILAAIPRFR